MLTKPFPEMKTNFLTGKITEHMMKFLRNLIEYANLRQKLSLA